MIYEFDDFGATHIISGETQSHDCRDVLDKLHYANPNFKVTLFTIPGELTKELADWCRANSQWVQLALHGFFHRDNWECSKMSYEEFDNLIKEFQPMIDTYFVKGFRAPGWQISDGVYEWLLDHNWWVADQSYNNARRPDHLQVYINDYGEFSVKSEPVGAWHGHTWDCVGNGIYETFPELEAKVRNTEEFKFVGELFND